MNANTRSALFWIVAVLALLWNLFGLFSFYYHLTATPDVVATWPETQQRIAAETPRWLFVPFGIATIAGVAGSLGLLLGRRWAVPVFLVSLLAVVVQFAAHYLTTPVWALTGLGGAILPLCIVAAAVFLWWYSRRCAARGWLR